MDEKLLPSVISYVVRQPSRLSHSKTFEELADRQDRPLEKIHRNAAKVLGEIKLSGWVKLQSTIPIYPVRDIFIEVPLFD